MPEEAKMLFRSKGSVNVWQIDDSSNTLTLWKTGEKGILELKVEKKTSSELLQIVGRMVGNVNYEVLDSREFADVPMVRLADKR